MGSVHQPSGQLSDGRTSERQEDVHHLLAVARLLHVRDLAAAAIGDAGLGDLRRIDRVVGLDVLGPDDAGDDQFADLEIDADLLLALDHEIAVRQNLRDDRRDIRDELLGAADRTGALARRVGVGVDERLRLDVRRAGPS